MTHNFSKKRYPVVENKIPKFIVGNYVTINSNQHIQNGKFGKIIGVYPAQNNVFYQVKIKNCGEPTIPERMLVLNSKSKGNKNV